MYALGRALRAEIMKTKSTLALAMTFLAPLAVVALQFAMYLDGSRGPAAVPTRDPWLALGQGVLVIWSLLMLPLFITLETALLSGIDHSGKHWTLLCSLPVPRWAYYAGKVLVSLALIGWSMLVLVGLTLLTGKLLQAIHPQLGLGGPVPWLRLLEFGGLTYLASWLTIAVQLWIGMRWEGFVVPLGAGIVATIMAIFLVNKSWAVYYPWTMPGLAAVGLARGEVALTATLLGALGGIVVALAGGWHISRRDVL